MVALAGVGHKRLGIKMYRPERALSAWVLKENRSFFDICVLFHCICSVSLCCMRCISDAQALCITTFMFGSVFLLFQEYSGRLFATVDQ